MLITLTSDLGTRDHYAGMVKGEILKAIPSAQLIDISHDIDPFNIFHGAFVLKNCYHHFPQQTIHLIGVNMNEPEADTLIIRHNHHHFIGPDNGIFGLIFGDHLPTDIFWLEKNPSNTLPMKDDYVQVLKFIEEGKELDKVLGRLSSFRQSALLQPQMGSNYIRGSIVYFDRFQNAVVNISREDLNRVSNGRAFFIHFKRYDDVEEISDNYFNVAEGEKLCLFNSSGFLEIAMNKGNAAGLLNLSAGDFVQIEFVG